MKYLVVLAPMLLAVVLVLVPIVAFRWWKEQKAEKAQAKARPRHQKNGDPREETRQLRNRPYTAGRAMVVRKQNDQGPRDRGTIYQSGEFPTLQERAAKYGVSPEWLSARTDQDIMPQILGARGGQRR